MIESFVPEKASGFVLRFLLFFFFFVHHYKAQVVISQNFSETVHLQTGTAVLTFSSSLIGATWISNERFASDTTFFVKERLLLSMEL